MKILKVFLLATGAIYFLFVILSFTPLAINHQGVPSKCTAGYPCAATGIFAHNQINRVIFATAPYIAEEGGYKPFEGYSVMNLSAGEVRSQMMFSLYIQLYWFGVSFVFGFVFTILYLIIKSRFNLFTPLNKI